MLVSGIEYSWIGLVDGQQGEVDWITELDRLWGRLGTGT